MFRATLVWTDPAVDHRSKKLLVNDLDLIVEINDTVYYPNGKSESDHINNVEDILLPPNLYPNDEGRYYVKIVVRRYKTSSKQCFALVVTGDFYDTPSESSKSYNFLPTPTIIPKPNGGGYDGDGGDDDDNFDDLKKLLSYILYGAGAFLIIVCCCISCIYSCSKQKTSHNGQRNNNTVRPVVVQTSNHVEAPVSPAYIYQATSINGPTIAYANPIQTSDHVPAYVYSNPIPQQYNPSFVPTPQNEPTVIPPPNYPEPVTTGNI